MGDAVVGEREGEREGGERGREGRERERDTCTHGGCSCGLPLPPSHMQLWSGRVCLKVPCMCVWVAGHVLCGQQCWAVGPPFTVMFGTVCVQCEIGVGTGLIILFFPLSPPSLSLPLSPSLPSLPLDHYLIWSCSYCSVYGCTNSDPLTHTHTHTHTHILTHTPTHIGMSYSIFP